MLIPLSLDLYFPFTSALLIFSKKGALVCKDLSTLETDDLGQKLRQGLSIKWQLSEQRQQALSLCEARIDLKVLDY